MSVWDGIPDRQFVRFVDGVVVVRFEGDEPTETVNDYKKTCWNFDVDGELSLSVSSKGLMRLLKKELPLTGKTFKITRSGHGIDTTYQVTEIIT